MNIEVKVCQTCGQIHPIEFRFSYCRNFKCWGSLVIVKLDSELVKANLKPKEARR